MPDLALDIAKPNVLVVEGRDEERFFDAFIKQLKLQDIQIMEIGGKTKLRDRLKALSEMRQFRQVISLGIVRDANGSPSDAFRSVCGALRTANLPVPECPLLSVGDSPRVTIMILPEEDVRGALEDLCLRAVMSDPAITCVDQYFQCLKQQGFPPPHNPAKAKVQVFLGSRREEGKRLGEAAQAGYWPWDDTAFGQVKNFLRLIVA